MDSVVLQPKRASGKRPKKRKFTGNIHTRKKVPELKVSASSKKIKLSDDVDEEISNYRGYRIIDIDILISSIENCLCCKACGSGITLSEEVLNGLLSEFKVSCKRCDKASCFKSSQMTGIKNNSAEVNLRSAYAMRGVGMGYSSLELFCGLMDLPSPVSRKSYNGYIRKIESSSQKIALESKSNAAQQEAFETGSNDIIVSGDGSWKTRGHTSRIGVCTLIGDRTGKVIDTEVLSSFCKACDSWKPRRGTPEFDNWFAAHEKDCLLNHSGSAGKMELVGMTRMFHRSEVQHNVKYVGYIGDGDARTFAAIKESEPYGDNVDIQKLECVGHIQKRMGTRLRKLKQSKVKCSDGKSLEGKGRLTIGEIDKLTIYYGNAIREHKNNLEDMYKAVWAVYFHTRSTDVEPLHTLCPVGPNSWCKYQKAIAAGTVGSFKHKPRIALPCMDAIRPVFNDLSKRELLRRCLGGKTQNSNESINNVIWRLCPKTFGAGRRIAEIATNEATILFNDGNLGRLKVMKDLGLSVGLSARECLSKLDEQRIKTAEHRHSESTKEIRQMKRNKLKAENEKLVLQEGVSYSAGDF